ncbi:MAG: hypothetical protein CL468_03800 [Acidimicrobiaceae bacterium]|nr:hypothetical protein [Acidimicrobiaceae bacterium]
MPRAAADEGNLNIQSSSRITRARLIVGGRVYKINPAFSKLLDDFFNKTAKDALVQIIVGVVGATRQSLSAPCPAKRRMGKRVSGKCGKQTLPIYSDQLHGRCHHPNHVHTTDR